MSDKPDFEKIAKDYSLGVGGRQTYIKCGPRCLNDVPHDYVDHTHAIASWYKQGLELVWNSDVLPLQEKIKELELDLGLANVLIDGRNERIKSCETVLETHDERIAELTQALEKQQSATNFYQPLYEQSGGMIEYLNGRIAELERETQKGFSAIASAFGVTSSNISGVDICGVGLFFNNG